MPPRRSYGSRKPTQKCALTAVHMLLTGCRPEKLAEMTAESLVASYGVTLAKAEELLAGARRARANG